MTLPRAVIALLLLAAGVSACKKEAASYDAAANVTAPRTGATGGEVVIDTAAPGQAGLNTGTVKPKKLPEASAESVEAAFDRMHRAIALVQTGRFADLAPLLTERAAQKLRQAGGNNFLTQYRSARVELAPDMAKNPDERTLIAPFVLHVVAEGKDVAKPGLVTLVRRAAAPWQIDDLKMYPDTQDRKLPSR